MLQITPHLRILLAAEPTDFRRGIDGLCRVCREHLDADPMSGAMFVFRNRRAKALKILVYDGQGFWLCQKRLSAGRFRFWPTSARGKQTRRLEAYELQVLLACGDPEAARGARPWRRIGEELSAVRVRDPYLGSPTSE
ncbi:MAG: IS66 family insertion sequence element accessory protein TnpB [Kiritimatiellae bacterium]|nr:IS66 family insertion sequence element accessory protein TnpB [Kiritimatiellia bacterium]